MTKKVKKILILGGSKFQVPAIKCAKELGLYVITCDNLSQNPGHKMADKYFNISTTDYEKVTELAKVQEIDGVLAYASDPAAFTASYVSEAIGLAGNPSESISILTNKALFRKFQFQHNYNAPRFIALTNIREANDFIKSNNGSWVIKPVDSSGSRGVNIISNPEQLSVLFQDALKHSRIKEVLIEEFIETNYHQLHANCFVSGGKLVFSLWGDHYFDKSCNNFVPIATFFPSKYYKTGLISEIDAELQKIINDLKIETCAFDIEVRIDKGNRIFFLELGPRTGGDYVPQVMEYSTGFPITKACIEATLGIQGDYTSNSIPKPTTYYSLHTNTKLIFNEINFSDKVVPYILDKYIHVRKGDVINPQNGANDTYGHLILQFDSYHKMVEIISEFDKYYYLN